MIITEITYKRIKNLGNYENETLEITAEIKEGENYLEAIDRIRYDVAYIMLVTPSIKIEDTLNF
jgi:hypothetical protein